MGVSVDAQLPHFPACGIFPASLFLRFRVLPVWIVSCFFSSVAASPGFAAALEDAAVDACVEAVSLPKFTAAGESSAWCACVFELEAVAVELNPGERTYPLYRLP